MKNIFRVEVKRDADTSIGHYKTLVEATLGAFGFAVCVVDVVDKKTYTKVRMEIAMVQKIDDILKLDKDIALAVASPTGKVKIIAPIPGTSLVRIKVPKKKQ